MQTDQTVTEAPAVEPIAAEPKDTSIPLAERIAAAKAAREAEQKRTRKTASVQAVASHPAAKKAVAKLAKTPSKKEPTVKKDKQVREIKKVAGKKIVVSSVSKKKETGSSGSGKALTEAICSICHKPLSRHTSVSQGMGDTCAAKIKMLPKGVTLEQHYESMIKTDVPDGWIKLSEAIEKARKKGISGYRFIQACGGDRMIRKPINSFFKVIFVANTRYINGECMKHLGDLEKV